MTATELQNLLESVQKVKAESPTLELKAASTGCPTRLYDTLSSFANQDDGGIILFGVDESNGFMECGVYNPQDLIKHVTEQCKQMTPIIRPVFTTISKDDKSFVAAEIPGLDVTDRPCFYAGRGRLRGSYVRVGDSDEPMTEYEIYSYEAFRRRYQDDIRPVDRATYQSLDMDELDHYLENLKKDRPNLANLSRERICELMSMTRNGVPTLAAIMLFSPYPQVYFPQLCITAISVPGTEIGEIGTAGERFLDNQRIEGTLIQMLDGALAFIRKNTRAKTVINPETGRRSDQEDYPTVAVREAVLNALVHRDYSIHTEGMPIQLLLFEDRLEIRNPGGLYGRLQIDQLGKVQPDTRNPVLAVAMEVLNQTENRYSGIPTIKRALAQAGMPEPKFQEERGSFVVCFRKAYSQTNGNQKIPGLVKESKTAHTDSDSVNRILDFCQVARTRKELADFLEISSVSYAIKTYILPLVETGQIQLTLPETPRSPKQKYFASQR